MKQFKTDIAKVRGLGSAKSGTEHFIWQRFTAVVMIFLSAWLVGSVMYITQAPMERLPGFIASPFNVAAAILFIAFFLWHSVQGLQVVIEDYVHCRMWQYTLLFLLNFICIVSFVMAIIAIFDVRTFIN